MDDLQRKNGGFTYIEILVCLVILALFITPMSYAFLITIKINRSAIEQERVTAYTEQLLEDIKYQMTQDIELQQKVLGTRYKLEGKTEIEIKKAKEGVSGYLVDADILFINGIAREDVALDEFLTSIGDTNLVERYDMDQYAYEIALWRISDIALINHTLLWDKSTLKKATKIYSDKALSESYSLHEGIVENGESLITFKITPEMLKIFKDDTLSYIPNQIIDEKVLEYNRIQFNTLGIPEVISNSSKETMVQIQPFEILDVSGVKRGYIFHLYEGAMSKVGFSKNGDQYKSIIEIDVRNLLRKSEDLSEETTYDQFTFKFINHTAYNQFIHIRKNLIDTEDEERVNRKFNIILEDKKDGRSFMTQVNDSKPYENYLIAIVVRDKQPVQGQVGKVVKKMMDVYSYRKNK